MNSIKISSSSSSSSMSSTSNSDDEGYPRHVSKSKPKLSTFQSAADKKHHESFFRSSVEILLNNAIFSGLHRDSKLNNYQHPDELKSIIDFNLHNSALTHEDLLTIIKDVIEYSVKPGHPYFVNQLFSSVDPYGLIGQWLTDSLNPSVYTYEVSPVIILMEEVVLKEMRKIVGWTDGNGDGIFCPGGSIANGYAISCARHKMFPETKEKGLHSLPRLVLYTSEDAHYSIKKLSSFLGIGSSNVIAIPTESNGKMSIEHLERAIEKTLNENGTPFLVSATAGTTVLGAFDPIHPIADLCEKHNMWLHVDAAWGGGALVSKRYRGLMDGIERADSVTWNPHKLLTAPQQCSTFLVKHEGILTEAHSTNAAYLFQKDKFYDTSYDTGDKHIQCGRRADVLKFWFMWKAKGTSGLEAHIDKVFENAEYFLSLIQNRDDFVLVLDKPECTNICFWYIPDSLTDKNFGDKEFEARLNLVAPKIKERMMREGCMMVTYQQQKGLPNFFRIVFQNSGLEKEDMDHFVEEFVRLGKDL